MALKPKNYNGYLNYIVLCITYFLTCLYKKLSKWQHSWLGQPFKIAVPSSNLGSGNVVSEVNDWFDDGWTPSWWLRTQDNEVGNWYGIKRTSLCSIIPSHSFQKQLLFAKAAQKYKYIRAKKNRIWGGGGSRVLPFPELHFTNTVHAPNHFHIILFLIHSLINFIFHSLINFIFIFMTG